MSRRDDAFQQWCEDKGWRDPVTGKITGLPPGARSEFNKANPNMDMPGLPYKAYVGPYTGAIVAPRKGGNADVRAAFGEVKAWLDEGAPPPWLRPGTRHIATIPNDMVVTGVDIGSGPDFTYGSAMAYTPKETTPMTPTSYEAAMAAFVSFELPDCRQIAVRRCDVAIAVEEPDEVVEESNVDDIRGRTRIKFYDKERPDLIVAEDFADVLEALEV